MRRGLGLCGLAFWLAGTAVAFYGMSHGVIAEPVRLHVGDIPIRGMLYRPRSAETDLPLVVLLHGTATSYRSCVPGLALPLARHGYLVLALDLQGHGSSGGSIPRKELDTLTATPTAVANEPEVDAAIDFLKQQSLYIGRRPYGNLHFIGLVGHSRGGWIAASVGRRRTDVDGVVTIGSAPLLCDPCRPRNLLILTSRQDQLCPLPSGCAALAQATGGSVCQPETRFGNFWRGNARRLMVVNNADHLMEMASPAVSTRVVEWLDSSLHLHPNSARTEDVVTIIGAAVLVALVGGLMVGAALARTFVEWLPPAPRFDAEPPRPWRFALLAVLLVLVVPLAAAVASRLDVGPIYRCCPALVFFALVAVCPWVAGGRRFALSPWVRPNGPALKRAILLGGVFLGAGMIALGVPLGITWLELLPGPPRWLVAGVLFATLLLPSLVLAGGLQRLFAGSDVWVQALAFALVAVLLWLANDFLVASRHPLFLVPVGLTAASFLLGWPLWMVRHRPGLTVARALCHAGGLAWLLACHLPFVQG